MNYITQEKLLSPLLAILSEGVLGSYYPIPKLMCYNGDSPWHHHIKPRSQGHAYKPTVYRLPEVVPYLGRSP